MASLQKEQIKQHNQKVLDELEAGDLIEFERELYSHWAVYAGDGRVIHLAGVEGAGKKDNIPSSKSFTICGKRFDKACVRLDDFWDVCADCKAYKNNSEHNDLSAMDSEDIVKRARSKIGDIGYNVIWRNCEHFATWCRYDKATSCQSDSITPAGLLAAAGTAGAGAGVLSEVLVDVDTVGTWAEVLGGVLFVVGVVGAVVAVIVLKCAKS